MTVKLFNGLYFLFILLYIILTIGLDFFLKNKSDKFKKTVILILLFSGFALHFLKQLFEPYKSDPYSFRKSTFENICAVSTLIFPFIFLCKKQALRDYMVIIGMLSGIAAVFFPTEAFNKNPFTFDVLRFYYCHYVIFVGPYLMARFKFHEISYKRLYNVPIVFIGVLFVILVNEVVLISLGMVEKNWDTFFDPNIRNSSLIFGISDNMRPVGSFLLDSLSPKFFKVNPYTHEEQYWPIVWIVIPVFVYCYIFGFVFCCIFRFDEVKEGYRNAKGKIIQFINNKKEKKEKQNN